MSTQKKFKTNLGRVVVVGGNGFLGHHIVNQLLEDWTADSVSSVDLRCEKNRNSGAAYYECDITDQPRLLSILEDIKPNVVIHTASPAANDVKNADKIFLKVNVDGTKSVIEACQKAGVQALVFTSSASVVCDTVKEMRNVDERWPVLKYPQQPEFYSHTKALAEEAVLAANRQEPYKLLTAAIRPSGIFGEGDVQYFHGVRKVYLDRMDRIQVGDNTNLFDSTYVGNVAHCHLLAARLLVATAAASTIPLDHERVDGEAFIVTNDEPMYFWDFVRAIWRAFGSERGTEGVWTLSKDMGIFFGWCSEMACSVTGKKPTFSRLRARVASNNRYYNISKAKRVLGYEPRWTLQEAVERSAKWFLAEEQKTSEKKGQ